MATESNDNVVPAKAVKTDDFLAIRLRQALSSSAEQEEVEPLQLMEPLLADAIREGASDIHLDPFGRGYRVRLRIDGRLCDAAIVRHEQGLRLCNQFKALAGLDPVPVFVPEHARLSCEFDVAGVDLRITVTPCLGGEKLSIRLLDERRMAHQVEEIGLSKENLEQLRAWMAEISGMLLVTGPTGSGKTTTLYALLQAIEATDRCILTIEDPVEYKCDGITQMQVDPEHDFTFERGLETMLRLDPDFLLVGEIRSDESAEMAIGAAATGHMVMSTLHCPDAVGAVTALRNWEIRDYEIAAALRVVVAQRLVRRLCQECREETVVTDDESRWMASRGLTVPDKVWRGAGCDTCRGLGYKGRTGIFELWRLSADDLDMIAAQCSTHELSAALVARNHTFMMQDAQHKLAAGITTPAELQRSRMALP